jgi:hypothetical protein
VCGEEAKKILRSVLADYTVGSVPLQSEVVEEEAKTARLTEEDGRFEQLTTAACTLFVVGLGLHSILPR